MKRSHTLALAAVAAGAVSLAPAAQAGGGAPQKKTVKISDNQFTPAKLTVNYGSTVTWKWPSDAGDTHDVTLKKGPAGVKKFQSDPFASEASYKRTFKKSGTYKIICTFHETEMSMTIVVRKKPSS